MTIKDVDIRLRAEDASDGDELQLVFVVLVDLHDLIQSFGEAELVDEAELLVDAADVLLTAGLVVEREVVGESIDEEEVFF